MHPECMDIQNGFSDYLGGDKKAIKTIEKAMSKIAKKKISITVRKSDSLFAMAITPNSSVIDKVASAILSNEHQLETVSSLWKKCDDWTLDIDDKIFNLLNAGELTALTMHEIGHITAANTIPRKICDIIQYKIGTSKISQKAMLKNKTFAKILQIPISAACLFDPCSDNIKEEIYADKMAVHNGYLTELISAMDKIKAAMKADKRVNSVDIKGATDYTQNVLNMLANRKEVLVKSEMRWLQKTLPNSMFKESVDDVFETWFEDGGEFNFAMKHLDGMIEAEYFAEFGLGHKLAPIQQDQIDYIEIKIQGMTTINDKMMIVSYINGKIELAEYYLQILNDTKLSKKYKVPHSKASLEQMLESLQRLRNMAIHKKIDDGRVGVNVYYPKGYYG